MNDMLNNETAQQQLHLYIQVHTTSPIKTHLGKVESNLFSASHPRAAVSLAAGCSAVINKIIISAVHKKRHDDLVLGNPQRGSRLGYSSTLHMRLQGFPWRNFRLVNSLPFTMIPIWHFSMLFFLSIVQMGFEGRDAGVAVRGERVI